MSSPAPEPTPQTQQESVVISPAANTPQVGWRIHAGHYTMADWASPASIFLACKPDGSDTMVSWWFHELTPWHGYWTVPEPGGLFICFNCYGPGVDPLGNPRKLHGSRVRRSKENPYIYKGKDAKKREVKIEFYDTWMVSEGGVRLSSIDGPGMKRRRIDLTGN